MTTDSASQLGAPELRRPSVVGPGDITSLVPAGGNPTRIVRRQTARKALRSGALWGLVFGLYVALQASTYASQYKTPASRLALARSLSSSSGLNALVGPAHDLQTVGGFTTWKCLGILTVLGAVWALMLSTKLMRGEEDAGRWELFLAGQTTPRRAVAQALSGLGAGVVVLFGLTALVTVAIGRTHPVHLSSSSAVFFALAVTSGAAMFMAGGALCSQLAASRRQATAYAGTALGLFFALRMVADSTAGLNWLLWATPLGWVEQLQPFTNPRPAVLILIFGLSATMAGLTVTLAGARDLGGSTLPDRSSAKARTSLLTGNVGLTARLIRPTMLGWWAAVAAFGFLLGMVAKQAARSLEASSSAQKILLRLGGRGAEVKAYLGISFLIIAVFVVLISAGQITAGRREEATGRLEHFLVRPVSRVRWMAGRLGVAAAAVALGGALAGTFAWLGAASQHTSVSFSSLLGAGLNTVPAAVCLLGIGALAWGLAPRVASYAVYGVLAWAFLIELLAGIAISNHWLLDTSIFHQFTAAPVQAPNWSSGGAMIATGVVAAALGTVAFAHRDLAGE